MIGFKFWALVLIVMGALAFSRRSLDFTQMVILSLTLWQAISHFRHVPFFAILAGFWVGPHLQSVLVRWRNDQAEKSPSFESPKAKLAFTSVMVLMLALIGYRLHRTIDAVKS